MRGVDELAGVRASRGWNDADLIREACELASRHAFEIDPDPEARGEVAKRCEIGDETRAIGIVAAKAETLRAEFAGALHRREGSGLEVRVNNDEFNVVTDRPVSASRVRGDRMSAFAQGGWR
jgi:hypothetical protein